MSCSEASYLIWPQPGPGPALLTPSIELVEKKVKQRGCWQLPLFPRWCLVGEGKLGERERERMDW